MSMSDAPENELDLNASDDQQLDDAIDGLRDVLKQDSEGLDLSSNSAEADGVPDLGADFGGDFAGGDLGSDLGADFASDGELGGDFAAGGDFGSDLGSDFGGELGSDLGSDFGGDLGSDFGADAGTGDSDFGGGSSAVTGATGPQTRTDLVLDIPIDVQVILGTSRMQVSDLMELNEGATIALERKIGEPVEIMVNSKIIGRGEITVLENDDTKFGIKMIEVVGSN